MYRLLILPDVVRSLPWVATPQTMTVVPGSGRDATRAAIRLATTSG